MWENSLAKNFSRNMWERTRPLAFCHRNLPPALRPKENMFFLHLFSSSLLPYPHQPRILLLPSRIIGSISCLHSTPSSLPLRLWEISICGGFLEEEGGGGGGGKRGKMLARSTRAHFPKKGEKEKTRFAKFVCFRAL